MKRTLAFDLSGDTYTALAHIRLARIVGRWRVIGFYFSGSQFVVELAR